ncbi:methyltransferase domain-containing protein [Rhodobacterales bacterium]|nr:methyltransferase domain-containing protein [Rhodobacterales bacterium]
MPHNDESASTGTMSLKDGSTDSSAIASYYDQWADTYDETLVTWDYKAPKDAVALLSGHLQPGARVLDVGCGTGLVSEALKRQANYRIDGLDISPASLKRAGERSTYEDLVCHDLQKLPLPVESDAYDAAISVGVLTYIEDAPDLLRDLCRTVRSDGVIGFTQRTDRWQDLDFKARIDALAAEGLWSVVHISEPHGYLPGNEDFAEEIKIIHTVCRVS